MFTRLRSLSNRGLPTLHPPEAPATTAAGDDRKSIPVHDESFSFRLDIPTPDSDIYDSFEQAQEKKEEEEYLLRSACFDPDPIELLSFDDNTLRGYLDLDTPLCGERGDEWAELVQSAAVDVHLEAEGEQDGLSAPAVDTAVDTTTAADTDIATETGVATNMHINDSAVSLSPPSTTPTQQQQQLQQPLQQQEYDNIGTRYKSLEDSPLGAIDFATTRKALGNVKGLKVLDLACGIGRWARWCVEHGDAERVVGIDISETMVEGANEMKTNLTDERLKERLEFRVGDCSVPLSEEEGGRGFDLVLGSWYRELPTLFSLTYSLSLYDGAFVARNKMVLTVIKPTVSCAPNRSTLVTMFRNIFNNLKPGGRFIGVVPNSFCPMYEPYEYYDLRMSPLEEVEPGAWKCKFEYLPDENVVFETYARVHSLYEEAAEEAEAGMRRNIRWIPYILPPGDDREESGYWDAWKLRPHSVVIECVRPRL